jgi:hypothetical protein
MERTGSEEPKDESIYPSPYPRPGLPYQQYMQRASEQVFGDTPDEVTLEQIKQQTAVINAANWRRMMQALRDSKLAMQGMCHDGFEDFYNIGEGRRLSDLWAEIDELLALE